MDFQSAMETFAEAWVAANTKGATLGDVACAHQQAQGMALAMTSPGIPTSSAAASLSPPSSVARSPASPPPPPPPLSHPLKHSPPHPSATPPPTSATPPSTPVASESAAASQPLTRCGDTTPSAEGQTIGGAALKEKSSAVGVGKSPSGKSIPVHCIVEAISVEVAPPRVPPPTSPTSSHHGTRTASSCPPSPPGHPPSSSTSPPPLSPSPNKRPASPTSQSSPPSTPKTPRRGPPPPSVPSPPPSTPFSPPLIEMDSFAIIPASTPFRDILPVALQRLGYPRSTAAAARGSVVIRNWRPLSLERIPESPSASVAEVLGEISSFATLRIQVFRARSMSGRCSTPAATSPPPTAPSSASRHHHHSRAQQQAVAAAMGNGNSSVSPVSEMRDKLLRILLSHSHALLASSGCSIDEQGRQAASQSRIPLPPPPPPPPPSSQPQDYTSPSAEARRKFDGWYASLHPEHHHHHAASHHHHHSPQLQHHLMQQPPGVAPGSGGGGGRRTPTSPPPPPVSSAASPVTPAALLRHPAMHQHPHHHPMPHPGLHHSPYGAPPSVEMKQLLSPKLEALGLGDHVVHPALQTVQSQYPTQKTRMRTSFDPELELPKLQRWFSDNQHPSRHQIQLYVKELNSLESRRGRKPLDVNNVVYWFKNARAAQKRAELRHLNGYAAASSAAAAHHAAAAAAAAHHASSAAVGSQEGEPYALMGAGRRKASTPGQRRPEDEDGGGAGGVDDEDDDGENGARRSGEGGSAKGDHGSFRSSSAASSSAPASPIPSYLVEVKQEPPEGSPAQSKPSDSMQHGEEMDDDEDDEDDEEDDDEEEEDEEHRRNGEGGREAPSEGNDNRRRPPEGRTEGGTVGEEDDEDEEDVEVEDGGEDEEDEAGRKRRISPEYAEAGEEDEAGQRQLVPRVGGLVDRLGFPLIPNSMFSHSIMYMSHYIPPGLQQAAMAAAAAAAASGGGENLPGGGPGGGGSASASPASMIPQGDERRKRNRTFIDPVTEVPRLEQWFSVNTHPSHNLILKYTEELNRMPYRQKFPRLEPKNVQFWFKNRRAKCKRLKMSLEQPGSAPYAYKTE